MKEPPQVVLFIRQATTPKPRWARIAGLLSLNQLLNSSTDQLTEEMLVSHVNLRCGPEVSNLVSDRSDDSVDNVFRREPLQGLIENRLGFGEIETDDSVEKILAQLAKPK